MISFVYANLHNTVYDKHNMSQVKKSQNILSHTIRITRDLMISAIVVKGEKRESLSSFRIKNIAEV